MKVLVISDSHAHIANLKTVAEIALKSKVDAIVHAGDWNTIEAVNVVLSTEIPLYSVLGNADIDPLVGKSLKVKSKRFGIEFLIVNIGDKRIGMTHKPSDNKRYFIGEKLDLIINGHLHSKYESTQPPIRIIRPGALVNGINFAMYDTVSGKVEFINENEQI